jgi:hypothetical protein
MLCHAKVSQGQLNAGRAQAGMCISCHTAQPAGGKWHWQHGHGENRALDQGKPDKVDTATLKEKLRTLEIENRRLTELLAQRQPPASKKVPTWVWEPSPGKALRLFHGNNRTYYLIADENHTYLGALNNQDGKQLWRTVLAGKLPISSQEGEWSLEESRAGKELVLTRTGKSARVRYSFDNNGKLLREAPILSTIPHIDRLFKTAEPSGEAAGPKGFAVKLLGSEELPKNSKVKIFALQHASAADVSRILKDLFPEKDATSPRITADERGNSLLVRGRAKELEAVAEIIRRLEVSSRTRMKRTEGER